MGQPIRRIGLHGQGELPPGFLEVSPARGSISGLDVGPAPPEEPGQALHPGIAESDRVVPVGLEVLPGLLPVAEIPVGETQGVVDRARLGLELQGPLEALDRLSGAIPLLGHATQTPLGHGGQGIQRQDPTELLLRSVQRSLVQMDLPQTEESGHVVRLQLQGRLQGLPGRFQATLPEVENSQVVGPPELLRIQAPGVGQGRLRRHHEIVGQVVLPHLSVGLLESFHPHRLVPLQKGVEGGAHLPDRLPVRRRELIQDRNRNRLQVQARRRSPDGRTASEGRDDRPQDDAEGRGDARRDRGPVAHHEVGLPSPFRRVVYIPAGGEENRSFFPSGHRTRTSRTSAPEPRPKRTRGSLADA